MDDDIPRLRVQFDPSAFKAAQVADALERILDKLGCPACGRLDVHIEALEDPEWGRLTELDPVLNVSVIQDAPVLVARRG